VNAGSPWGADEEARFGAFLRECGGAVRCEGDEHVFRCPNRDGHTNGDADPSASVRLGDDGRLLVHCHAGCTTEQIVGAIGWTLADLMPAKAARGQRRQRAPADRTTATTKRSREYASAHDAAKGLAAASKGTLVEFYEYRSMDGQPVGLVARITKPDGKKTMPQARCANGVWTSGGLAKPIPIFNLGALLAAPDAPVQIHEGERKAQVATDLGFVAVSCAMGAGNGKHTDLVPLAGRVVHLFADNDKAGIAHLHQLAQLALAAGAKQVLQVTLPDLPAKGDIVDFVEARKAAGANDALVIADIEAAIATAVDVTLDADPVVDDLSTDPPTPASDKLADQVVAMAKGVDLFHDDQGAAYATFEANGHRETAGIESRQFSQWLAARFYRANEIAVPQQAMKTASDQLSAMARFDGPRQNVFLRTARAGEAILVDLGNDAWQAVEITANGWSITDRPRVPFTRRTGMRPLPAPEPGLESLDALFELLHVEGADARLLVTAWGVNAIMPSSSYPILCATGEQGSGKTTLCRAIQRLVDPHQVEGRSPPRNEEDIAIAAQNAHVLIYENVSTISQSLSDGFCRVATGAGFAARKLFTNDDERQLSFCRPLIINGIDDLATRSDLADRVVHIHLEPIPTSRRQTEANLWRQFGGMHGRLLGALLTLVARVKATPDRDIPLERMAEFSQIGAKTAVALGLEPSAFIEAYKRNRDRSSMTALESSATGPVVLRMLQAGPLRRPIGALLFELQTLAHPHEQRHPDWPKHPRQLGNELRRLSPNFARVGIRVQFPPRRNDGCWVEILPTSASDVHHVHHVHREDASG
jgi:putative DNA primase/helicase